MDGKIRIQDSISGTVSDSKQLGEHLAKILIDRGAKKLLEEAKK